MARRATFFAILAGAAALAASAGIVSARPNTNGGNQADYCRAHCAPIAVASQRESCEAACNNRHGPIDIACLPGADGACGEVSADRGTTTPPHRSVPPVTGQRGYRALH
jgi:hypothetical protein